MGGNPGYKLKVIHDVHIKTRMPPAEDLIDKEKANELFTKQQREDLIGEELADGVIMEAGDRNSHKNKHKKCLTYSISIN